jgi:small subunit ribosomal protein S6
MNFYESLFIINPALDDMEVKKVVDKVEGLIKKEGGEILKVDNWGKKKLAYEVKRQKKGYYILINIRVKASTISELERSLKLTDPVIKFLIIRLDKEPALNNPVMHEVQEHAGEEQRIAEGHRSMTDREGK